MAEQTPTDTGADETSSDVQETSQLEQEQQDESAVEQQGTDSGEESQGTDTDSTSEESQDNNEEESGSSSDDKELAKFAKGQGFEDISDFTERELELLRRQKKQVDQYRNDPKRKEKVRKEVDSLYEADQEATVDEQNALRIAAIEARQYTDDFWAEHAEDREHEPVMVDMLQEIKEKEGEEAARYWANNLDRLLVQAKHRAGAFNPDMARESGRREEREELRKKQQASAQSGHAVSQSGRSTGKLTRADIETMDDAEYVKLRDSGELDAMIARGDLY